MIQQITLIGGPAHGREFLWDAEHGDRLEFLGTDGDLSAPAEAEGFRNIARPARSIYLRSVVTPTIFVWQP